MSKSKYGCEACGFIACACTLQSRHKPECKFRVSATCAVGIECEHGFDTCLTCDPCTCGAGIAQSDFGAE